MKLDILIGDDNPTILQALSRMLSDKCVVQVGSGGRELIELFLKYEFDAVILDINFPSDVTGIEVARKIRSINPRIPIMMMSALPLLDETNQDITSLGASFCVKPISLIRICKFIDSVQKNAV